MPILRILFWNELFLPAIGGAEIFTARLGHGLIERGHHVSVVADRIPATLLDAELIKKISVHRFPFRASLRSLTKQSEPSLEFPQIMKAIRSLKEQGGFDIVHVNFSGPNLLFHLRTLNSSDAPTIVTFQTALSAKSGYEAGLVRKLLQAATRVVSVSEAALENVVQCTGYPRERISVIYPGIPPALFGTSPERQCDIPTVAFIGRLVKDKGADLAIRAMLSLRGAARLNVIGDGPERSNLRALADELSLEETVIFSGYVSNGTRRKMLSEASILVVPSRHEELFGMVAAEGAFSSLPVVTCSTGGLPEVVLDGVTGIVVPTNDAEALSSAIHKLSSEPVLAKKMGEAGRQRALKKFSIEKTIDDYESLYKSAIRQIT